ncbi:TetR/AcrR family transcriptional regulator [Chondromyces crocatus]|uniref:HTH tetR-type domain-containing protein n=1 Tax=Chondromyces crocatus TaxID=52 RepID=A0A0K1EPY4_CHOCO|nr:TetR/AcrR family transcriptional regulator [Chondromyces crocatus]AKT42911.1 uncharacterized protein CMC5_071390 [Chondromyces crocatus]
MRGCGDVAVKQVRGERLVNKVLDTTVEELSRVGYETLSIEAVAARADVNKTTVYRRWPTKRDLVKAALERVARCQTMVPDTGDLRTDMLQHVSALRDDAESPALKSVIRMVFAADQHTELAQLAAHIRAEKELTARAMYQRAIARGELHPDTDIELVHDVLFGAIQHLVLFHPEPCPDTQLAQVIDMVLVSASSEMARRRPTLEPPPSPSMPRASRTTATPRSKKPRTSASSDVRRRPRRH